MLFSFFSVIVTFDTLKIQIFLRLWHMRYLCNVIVADIRTANRTLLLLDFFCMAMRVKRIKRLLIKVESFGVVRGEYGELTLSLSFDVSIVRHTLGPVAVELLELYCTTINCASEVGITNLKKNKRTEFDAKIQAE